MRIETPRPRSADIRPKTSARGSASAFSALVSAAPPSGVAGVSVTARTSHVADIFLLQVETPDAEQRRRRQQVVRAAHDLLDGLEAMQRALALGTLTGSHFQGLARQMELAPSAAAVAKPEDAALTRISEAIHQRAAIELAKQEVRLQQQRART